MMENQWKRPKIEKIGEKKSGEKNDMYDHEVNTLLRLNAFLRIARVPFVHSHQEKMTKYGVGATTIRRISEMVCFYFVFGRGNAPIWRGSLRYVLNSTLVRANLRPLHSRLYRRGGAILFDEKANLRVHVEI